MSERSRENHYERCCFIQVTCNMNAKGQTWIENIATVANPMKIGGVNNSVKRDRGWWHKYTKQSSSLSPIYIVIEDSAKPEEPVCRSRHWLKTPRKQLKNRQH